MIRLGYVPTHYFSFPKDELNAIRKACDVPEIDIRESKTGVYSVSEVDDKELENVLRTLKHDTTDLVTTLKDKVQDKEMSEDETKDYFRSLILDGVTFLPDKVDEPKTQTELEDSEKYEVTKVEYGNTKYILKFGVENPSHYQFGSQVEVTTDNGNIVQMDNVEEAVALYCDPAITEYFTTSNEKYLKDDGDIEEKVLSDADEEMSELEINIWNRPTNATLNYAASVSGNTITTLIIHDLRLHQEFPLRYILEKLPNLEKLVIDQLGGLTMLVLDNVSDFKNLKEIHLGNTAISSIQGLDPTKVKNVNIVIEKSLLTDDDVKDLAQVKTLVVKQTITDCIKELETNGTQLRYPCDVSINKLKLFNTLMSLNLQKLPASAKFKWKRENKSIYTNVPFGYIVEEPAEDEISLLFNSGSGKMVTVHTEYV